MSICGCTATAADCCSSVPCAVKIGRDGWAHAGGEQSARSADSSRAACRSFAEHRLSSAWRVRVRPPVPAHLTSDAKMLMRWINPKLVAPASTWISVLPTPGTTATFARSSQLAATSIVGASPGTSFPKPVDLIEGVMLCRGPRFGRRGAHLVRVTSGRGTVTVRADLIHEWAQRRPTFATSHPQ